MTESVVDGKTARDDGKVNEKRDGLKTIAAASVALQPRGPSIHHGTKTRALTTQFLDKPPFLPSSQRSRNRAIGPENPPKTVLGRRLGGKGVRDNVRVRGGGKIQSLRGERARARARKTTRAMCVAEFQFDKRLPGLFAEQWWLILVHDTHRFSVCFRKWEDVYAKLKIRIKTAFTCYY